VRDDVAVTPEDSSGEVLRNLPRSRAHRRSSKRGAAGAAAPPKRKPAKPRAAAKPKVAAAKPKAAAAKPRASNGSARATQGVPTEGASASPRRGQTIRPGARSPGAPAPPSGAELLGTVVQAAAEVAQVGVSLGIKALRDATRRVPRP
jgi:hypothetical protein